MIVLLIAVAWMLLAAIVLALCLAARLGDDPPGAIAQAPRGPKDALGTSPRAVSREQGAGPTGLGRRPGHLPSNSGRAAFTKSLRRRAGLRRA